MVEIGQELDLHIERLGINGEGVSAWEGYTIFVEGALPGESVRAKLYEKRKSFGRAKVIGSHKLSAERIEPICPLFGRCGGCQLMHYAYEEQLKAKRQRVVDALERIGKLFHVEVAACLPSPSPFGYRNKIQLPVENRSLGLYAYNSHDLVPIEKCFIHCDLGEAAFQHIRRYVGIAPIEGLKHVLIKTAVNTGQVLVIFVVEKPLARLKPIAKKLMLEMPEIRGVVQCVNASSSNTILGSDFRPIAGAGFIEEKLCGLKFKVSPASFFQVNPAQAEKLYEKALELAALTGKERVLDAYCGVGTLSLIFANYAKEVIGVECVSQAIDDANENAKMNGIANASFTRALAEDFVPQLNAIDVAILNPPRKGCEAAVLEKIIHLRPKKVLYIACDPATLARDLAILTAKGFRVESVQPFDMFPQTSHVETLALLTIY